MLRRIGRHVQRHAVKLECEREQTRFSLAQILRIVERVDAMLARISPVIRQAHERIIGTRKVPNAEKIISVHHSDIHVTARGKAGERVEFCNMLIISINHG